MPADVPVLLAARTHQPRRLLDEAPCSKASQEYSKTVLDAVHNPGNTQAKASNGVELRNTILYSSQVTQTGPIHFAKTDMLYFTCMGI